VSVKDSDEGGISLKASASSYPMDTLRKRKRSRHVVTPPSVLPRLLNSPKYIKPKRADARGYVNKNYIEFDDLKDKNMEVNLAEKVGSHKSLFGDVQIPSFISETFKLPPNLGRLPDCPKKPPEVDISNIFEMAGIGTENQEKRIPSLTADFGDLSSETVFPHFDEDHVISPLHGNAGWDCPFGTLTELSNEKSSGFHSTLGSSPLLSQSDTFFDRDPLGTPMLFSKNTASGKLPETVQQKVDFLSNMQVKSKFSNKLCSPVQPVREMHNSKLETTSPLGRPNLNYQLEGSTWNFPLNTNPFGDSKLHNNVETYDFISDDSLWYRNLDEESAPDHQCDGTISLGDAFLNNVP